MNYKSREILDVFHAHAYTDNEDTFARNHIHGLSSLYLYENGYSSFDALLYAFKLWIHEKNYLSIFANGSQKECKALSLNIADIGLPQWNVRNEEAYHQVASKFKKLSIPILHVKCPKEAHSSFHGPCIKNNTDGELAKARHGYHCSLYDVFELYLCYVMTD